MSKGLVLHYPHKVILEDLGMDSIYNSSFGIVSVDPGVVNYGFRIETRHPNGTVVTDAYVRHRLEGDGLGVTPSIVLNEFLESYDYSNVKFVFIEKQLYFSAGASRIMQATITYFINKLRGQDTFPLIYEVTPSIKWRHLADKKPKDVKKWSINLAYYLLDLRKDKYSWNELKKSRKKDDLADVVTQSEAMMYELKLWKHITRQPHMNF